MELQRLNQNEETDKKKRSIALEASSLMQEENEEEDSDDEEDFSLFVKKFQKFVKKRRIERRQNFNNGRRSQEDSQVLRCYKCNQLGHIKAIVLQMKNGLRKVIRKGMKKEGPRRPTLHGMTMIHPMVQKRRLIF
ncbi:hypothetical protein DD573_29675 [Klebsiella pneumoniae]|nr:hypothetical protein DD573_29675 [Klebsiella pneumoniae]